MGHTSLELAEAAATCPSDTLAAKSCVVEAGGVEGCEDIEDSGAVWVRRGTTVNGQ